VLYDCGLLCHGSPNRDFLVKSYLTLTCLTKPVKVVGNRRVKLCDCRVVAGGGGLVRTAVPGSSGPGYAHYRPPAVHKLECIMMSHE